MRLRIVPGRIPARARSGRSWVLLLGAVAVFATARAVVLEPAGARLAGVRLPGCPLKTLTGVPCPFCGMTTATAHAVRGEIRAAWADNVLSPAFVLLCGLVGLYALGARLAAGWALDLRPDRALQRALRITAGLAIAASWAVNLHRHFRP